MCIRDRFGFEIDDLRFLNEAEWVWNAGGYVVELQREGINYALNHASETPIPGVYPFILYEDSMQNAKHLVDFLGLMYEEVGKTGTEEDKGKE